MTRLTLSSVSSLRRNIGGPCTVLRIHNGRVFAGSQEGILACWIVDSGEEVWKVAISGPLSDIDFSEGKVHVSGSSNICCLDYNSGEIVWSRELEGSSDYVLSNDAGIWATSSVYEIGIGDYTESTIWRFDDSGELQQRWTIAERCWFFGTDGRGLVLGLGRPRCGTLRVGEDHLEHLEISGAGPVTCGTNAGNRILLGHSDGNVSEIGGGSALRGASPVSAVLGVENETIAGFEDGDVVSKAGWIHSSTGFVAALSLGPSPSGNRAIWVCLDRGVVILDGEGGTPLLELDHGCRISESDSEGDIIVLGDSEGEIHLMERDVLSRRLGDDLATTEDDSMKRLMMDRLRGLRRG